MSKGSITGGGENGLYSVTIERDQGAPVTAPAWCADLTEDLSGDVGVIEIAGDRDKGINIQPGHDGNAAYDADRDGDLYLVPSYPPKEGQQAGVYWNWAMRPGWQKWRPNYRYGTITEIDHDADTCSVSLEACLSTDTPDGAAMDINQTAGLSAVPIEYMSCNSAAFSVGDEVVVKFEGFEWGGAKVIGFKQAPQACWWEPWGETLCANRTWWARSGGSWLACPGTLGHEYLSYSVASGLLTVTYHNPAAGNFTGVVSILRWEGEPSDSRPDDVDTCSIDWTIEVTDPAKSAVRVQIFDSSGARVDLYYTSASGITDIDLSSLNGEIRKVWFTMYVYSTHSCSVDIRSIGFS